MTASDWRATKAAAQPRGPAGEFDSRALTPARRRALATLIYGRRHDRPVTESSVTTRPERWTSMPLFVVRQTSLWLVAEGYASTFRLDGRTHVALTPAGVEFAEGVGL
jgi:hypothetical protein